MTLKLEFGKRYFRRDGQVTAPLSENEHPNTKIPFPFWDDATLSSYTEYGEYYGPSTETDGDLVAEVVEVAAAPEPAKSLAAEAEAIVNGARRSAYGEAEDNFERIARFWNAYLVNVGVLDAKALRDPDAYGITAQYVSPMMRLLKEARLCETPTHRDSFVDLIGYTLTGARVNKVE